MQNNCKVYVIELRRRVFKEREDFREANPHYDLRPECLYVGMTCKTPEERFFDHKYKRPNKKGVRINSPIASKYCIKLRPDLYEDLNLKPMNRKEAVALETKLAKKLRKQGYGVWTN